MSDSGFKELFGVWGLVLGVKTPQYFEIKNIKTLRSRKDQDVELQEKLSSLNSITLNNQIKT